MKRPKWQEIGQEPDYRFTLANERTFLAWIRTALAVLAGGVVLEQFAEHMSAKNLAVAVAIGLAFLAFVLAGCAYFRWKGNEVAMRHSGPLPHSPGIAVLSIAIGCACVVLFAELLLRP